MVGNKIDLRGGEVSNEDLENEVAPIMEEFKVRSSFEFTLAVRELIIIPVSCRKSRLALNALREFQPTSQVSSSLHKKQSYIRQRRCTIHESMWVFISSCRSRADSEPLLIQNLDA